MSCIIRCVTILEMYLSTLLSLLFPHGGMKALIIITVRVDRVEPLLG